MLGRVSLIFGFLLIASAAGAGGEEYPLLMIGVDVFLTVVATLILGADRRGPR